MAVIDYDMETGMGTARDSLIASTAALSVSDIHEGSSPWLMISAVIAALETLLNNNGALIMPKFRSVALPIVAAATAQDTALIVPAGGIILPGSFIQVNTLEATGGTKNVDIGVSGGDEDGILDGISVAAAGSIPGAATFTTGSNETYFASSTIGALLASIKLAGADVVGDVGTYLVEPYVCTAATTICYTLGSDDFAEMVASLFLHVLEP